VATKERLAAMAASLCAVCSGVMVVKLVVPDPRDRALELRTYPTDPIPNPVTTAGVVGMSDYHARGVIGSMDGKRVF
jgi:hypothetical protein